MKIKNDFVTNSSSTSFILSKPKSEVNGSLKVTVEMPLNNLLDSISDYKFMRNKEDVNRHVEEMFYGDDKEEKRNNFMKMIEDGKEIIIMTFSSDGGESGFERMVRNNPDSIKFGDGIEIIAQFEG